MTRAKRPRTAAIVFVSAAAAVLLVHAGGCSTAAEPLPSANDADAADARSARRPQGKEPDWQPEEPPSPLEGWKLLTEYDTACGFYYPTDRRYLPPPVKWEPCNVVTDAADLTDAGLSGPPAMVCERIAASGATSEETGSGAYLLSVYVEDNRAYLFVGRAHEGRGFLMVAEADGPVHTAIHGTGSCSTNALDEARFGHFMLRVKDSPDESTVGGAIGGSFDDLKPRVYFPKGHQPSTFYVPEYAVGRSLFIEGAGRDRVYSFATGELIDTITLTPEDQDLYYSGYRFHEDTLYWVASTSRRSAVKIWTKEKGIFTLLDHDHDLTRGVAGFATDGVDMVWREGRGRTNFNSLVFDVYETWTAKYSLDKATVDATKRRIHSEPRASMVSRYAVGCGYAAVEAVPPTPTAWGQTGLRVIRLSDGRSWPILGGSKEQQQELHFATPLGVTCEHVYVQAWSKTFSQTEAVRIRIDSLGEGVPAE